MAPLIVADDDWAPSHDDGVAHHGPSQSPTALPQRASRPAAANNTRVRSMSLTLLFRHRPKSSLFHLDGDAAPSTQSKFSGLALEKSRSHGSASHDRGHGHDQDHDQDPSDNSNNSDGNGNGSTENSDPMPDSLAPDQPLKFRRLIRRASVSVKSGVKGFVQRRPSVPAQLSPLPHDDSFRRHNRHASAAPLAAERRPATSHSTWHRLRQAASFHRHSRFLHTGHEDRPFGLDPIDSPALPVPGSGEQPPIIPRNTGAAARQAAATASRDLFEPGPSSSSLTPRPNWLASEEAGLDDYESGIEIALTSSQVEEHASSAEADSDVDVGVGGAAHESPISKVDFISRLPTELAIQVLAHLDAAALAGASRVSTSWRAVAANQHVWRESFLREKTATYATSGPVKPGAGLGVPAPRLGDNWKEIYRVKEQLDKRWRQGKARPVYLNGHSDSIYCLQFDESKIVTGSRDKTIRIWDMHTFACKLVIGPPDIINDPALSLLYDEEGNSVHYATLPESGSNPPFTAPLLSAHKSAPALVSFPTHHNASVLCLQYDDRILVTGSSDATCIVYNIRSGYRPVRRLCHHSAAVLDLVFDDKHIVTCSKDISICVWDRATGSLVRQLRGHSGPVNAVQMRGNTIVSCSGDFRVKLWNIDTGKNIREFSGHTKGLACSQFSEDGRYVASAGNDKVIRVWDANTGECAREIRAHENLVRSLHVDSVSGRLVSGSYDTDIKVFDMESGRNLLDFPRWHNSWVLSAKSDYRRIVSTGQDPKILILDFGAGIRGIENLESRPDDREPSDNDSRGSV